MHPEYNILIMYEEDFAMKLVIMEPLGVEKEALLALAEEKLEGRVEIEYYDTRVTDTDTLISRAKDAELLAFSNLPFPGEVLEACQMCIRDRTGRILPASKFTERPASAF